MISKKKSFLAHSKLLPFFLEWQIDPRSPHYNLCFSYHLDNSLHIEKLTNHINTLIKLKPHLRQTFYLEENKLFSEIHNELPAVIKKYLIKKENYASLEKKLIEEPHDLLQESSIKLNIIRFEDAEDCIILFNIHHIIMDALGIDSFIENLNYLLDGKSINEETSEDYIKKIQKEQLSILPDKEDRSVAEYLEKIDSIKSKLECPSSTKKHVLHYKAILAKDISLNLINFCNKNSISTFNVLLLAWGIFTSKMLNQSKMLVDYPVNIRVDQAVEGCFLSLVTNIIELDKDSTYDSVINKLKNQMGILKKIAHAETAFFSKEESITSFSHSSFAQPASLVVNSKKYAAKEYAQIAHASISTRFCEKEGLFYFTCDVFSDLFPDFFSETILPRFFHFLEKLLNFSNVALKEIDLLFEDEKQKLLVEFNNTKKSYLENKTFIDLFDEIVEKYPDNIAVKAFNGKLTYKELNERSEKLAVYLIGKGVSFDNIIAILIDNRMEMIVAIVAVLKSGAAYLPIAHETPEARIVEMLKDSEAKFLLTIPQLVKKLVIDTPVINIDKKFKTKPIYIKPQIKSNNLAYLIYTSGSTGKPKGVLIEHRSVVNYVSYLIQENQLDSTCIGSKYADFSFDASVIEIYPILFSGGTLCLIEDDERKDIEKVDRFFRKNKISYAFLPTQFAELFLASKKPTINTLIIGGDKVKKLANQSFNIINAYGPTEATVQSTAFKINNSAGIIPIGKPIYNTGCYVVDDSLNLVPIGLPGELLVFGLGLARGYHHHPTLTQQKFINHSFDGQHIIRLYKTGDIVRYLPDGNLEYIGRRDFQIKVRGYRIEPSEVENAILKIHEIDQVLVSALEDPHGNKFLCAYYSAVKAIDSDFIKNRIKDFLPDYMIPDHYIYLTEFAFSENGKINVKKLPKLDLSRKLNEYIPARDKKELLLCDAFSKTLDVEKISIYDDFFKLGGNSLKAVTLVTALQSNLKIDVATVYRLRTPANIASQVEFTKNNLKNRLENIKKLYIENSFSEENKYSYEPIYNEYKKSLSISFSVKSINSILLTGATGFLGSNLLFQLLNKTQYKIYLIVRAESDIAAFLRVNHKFRFYFDDDLNKYDGRLVVFAGDIEKNNLGLESSKYNELVNSVDSIIHSAALTKHYGNYSEFYSANVQATENLLELSLKTNLKDFNYISTSSVFLNNSTKKSFFDEDSIPAPFSDNANVYIRTKYEGEQTVIKYREKGVLGNIYRMGNLSFIYKNCRIQENKEESAFIHKLTSYLELKMIPREIELQEISPVDLAAEAIVKLFDKNFLNQNTFHLFNQNLFSLASFFSKNPSFIIKTLPIDHFINNIIANIDNSKHKKLIERFLLHQGWIDGDYNPPWTIKIFQIKTDTILSQLNFRWPLINLKLFNKFLINVNIKRVNMVEKRKEKIKNSAKILDALELVAESLPTPIYWENNESVIIGANEQVFHESGTLTRDAYIGKNLYQLYPYEMAEHIKKHNEEVMQTGRILSQEEVIKDVKTGQIKYYTAVKAPLYDDDGKVIGVIGTSINVTDKKIAEEQLKLEKEKAELANEAKSAFLATMSHEFRTPLNGILGMVQVLKEQHMAPEQKNYIEIIQKSGESLLALVNDILDFSVIESGSMSLKLETFSLHTLLEQIVTSIRPIVAKKQVTLVTNYENSIPDRIVADDLRVRQVLTNLIGNAAKFTLKGAITVLAYAEKIDHKQLRIIITVSDTGIGIPKDKLDLIFERFTQVESTYSRRFEGAGLGLAIVQRLLKLMDGRISVKSQIGVGSQFTIEIPVGIPAEDQKEPMEDINIVQQRKFNSHILLVEDNEINQQVAELFLKQYGVTTDVASTAYEAIELYTKNKYDLVFMDLSLPDGDGISTAKELIKINNNNKNIPIIALTAHVLAQDKERCLAVGIKEVLTKPMLKPELGMVLSTWCRHNIVEE